MCGRRETAAGAHEQGAPGDDEERGWRKASNVYEGTRYQAFGSPYHQHSTLRK